MRYRCIPLLALAEPDSRRRGDSRRRYRIVLFKNKYKKSV